MKPTILVIGSGISGLYFALHAARFANVVVATKEKAADSNTRLAQGGMAAVFADDDSFESHYLDTLRAGDGLCDEKSVKFLVKRAPEEIKSLERLGLKFDRKEGRLFLSREAVHSRPRIVHIKDTTGESVEMFLLKKVKGNKNIRILEHHQAVKLLQDKDKVTGALFLNNKTHRAKIIYADAVVLATGGLGRLFENTCNPEIATGDGFSLAYEAGAALQDMEFVQFHPTGLYGSKPVFLVSETVRGEGGI